MFKGKKVLVIGLGAEGRAACDLLLRNGAVVTATDTCDSPELRSGIEDLRSLGIQTTLGTTVLPQDEFDLAVLASPTSAETRASLASRKLQAISAMEVAAMLRPCLIIAVAGASGKTTTCLLIEHILKANGRKALIAGPSGIPFCGAVAQGRDMDYLIFEATADQLADAPFFRPSIAVLTNLEHGLKPQSPSAEQVEGPCGNLFKNQQLFDWAIVQSQALVSLSARGITIPAKVITFSSTEISADLVFERGWIRSKMESWQGPLIDTDHCKLRGPHNSENIMAALAVGRALRLPLEAMVESIQGLPKVKDCFSLLTEFNGVQFINDAACKNVCTLAKSLQAVAPLGMRPNVWLIAGGQEHPDAQLHDAGPVISQRVKGVFLTGPASEKLRAAWSLFTPCTVVHSLVEAVTEAARNAASGDAVLFSPACPGSSRSESHENRGEEFCQAVKSISCSVKAVDPNIM